MKCLCNSKSYNDSSCVSIIRKFKNIYFFQFYGRNSYCFVPFTQVHIIIKILYDWLHNVLKKGFSSDFLNLFIHTYSSILYIWYLYNLHALICIGYVQLNIFELYVRGTWQSCKKISLHEIYLFIHFVYFNIFFNFLYTSAIFSIPVSIPV